MPPKIIGSLLPTKLIGVSPEARAKWLLEEAKKYENPEWLTGSLNVTGRGPRNPSAETENTTGPTGNDDNSSNGPVAVDKENSSEIAEKPSSSNVLNKDHSPGFKSFDEWRRQDYAYKHLFKKDS